MAQLRAVKSFTFRPEFQEAQLGKELSGRQRKENPVVGINGILNGSFHGHMHTCSYSAIKSVKFLAKKIKILSSNYAGANLEFCKIVL